LFCADSTQFINEKNRWLLNTQKAFPVIQLEEKWVGTKCSKTLLKEAISVVSVAMSDPSLSMALRIQSAIAIIDSNNLKARTHVPADTDNG